MPPFVPATVKAGVVVGVATEIKPPVKLTLVTEPYANVGMSAVVNALKVGVAAAPLAGPAKIAFTACVVSVPVSVPLLVTGELVTAMIDGNDKPTEVTVPCGLAAVVMLVTRP